MLTVITIFYSILHQTTHYNSSSSSSGGSNNVLLSHPPSDPRLRYAKRDVENKKAEKGKENKAISWIIHGECYAAYVNFVYQQHVKGLCE